MADFSITRHTATKDSSLRPVSDRGIAYVRQYRKTFGDDALVGMSIYVETSRDESRLADAIADLRAQGFTVKT